MQYIYHACFIAITVIYIIMDRHQHYVYLVDYFIILMIIFIRINVISNKYATLSAERYMMYKDQLLTPLEISRDMYM